MEKNTEKIIAKIKKVLELSKNNPSENEAKSAALMAQKLMAEYHISISEVEGVAEELNIAEESVGVGNGNKWKYTLSNIIAKNFRCKCFFYGKTECVFYGYEADTKIAAEVFKFLFQTGNKGATNYYNKLRNEAQRYGEYFDGSGIKNSFLMGFLEGIKEELDKQCTALMIVVPSEVEESYKERISVGFKTTRNRLSAKSNSYSEQSRAEGRRSGRNAMGSRQLAMA